MGTFRVRTGNDWAADHGIQRPTPEGQGSHLGTISPSAQQGAHLAQATEPAAGATPGEWPGLMRIQATSVTGPPPSRGHSFCSVARQGTLGGGQGGAKPEPQACRNPREEAGVGGEGVGRGPQGS